MFGDFMGLRLIGIVADSIEEAIKICEKITEIHIGYNSNNPNILVTENESYFYIPNNQCFKSRRFNRVYVSSKKAETDWFKYVIKPMVCASPNSGICIVIDN